jgi:hypothetical protein
MSEQEAVLETEQHEVESTIQESVSPTASDSGESHEQKVEFSPEQQKVVNEIAAKKAFETREARRKAETYQKELETLRSKIPVEQAPLVPDLPDPYDDDFSERMAQRDKALQSRAQFDAQEQYQQQQYQLQEQERSRLESEKLNQSVTDYSGRAQKLGITDVELQAAGSLVAQYGINDQVTQHILADENGPLITKYLSKNPQAMDTMNSMSPISAALFIEQQVKPEAIKFKPQTTNAPAPIETLSGAGIPPTDGGPKDATYE